jgi:aconitate hydratase 2/2-methylisocitrate dehydratase
MNIYQDYIKEIEERKTRGFIQIFDSAELLSEIIAQIKDTGNADRADLLNFSSTPSGNQVQLV